MRPRHGRTAEFIYYRGHVPAYRDVAFAAFVAFCVGLIVGMVWSYSQYVDLIVEHMSRAM